MRLLPLLLLALLFTACAPRTGPAPFPVLGQTEFVNPQRTNDSLRLDADRQYTLRRLTPSFQRYGNNDVIEVAHYEVVNADHQIVVLNYRLPVRVSFQPNAALPYQFIPFQFINFADIPPAQRDNYVKMQNQFYAPKALLTPAPGELPLAPLLAPR